MTREEAADLLDNLVGMVEDNQESDYDTAIKMAIEALKRTDKHTETHECDYISRQAVVESFTQLWDCVGEIADRDEWEDVCRTTANGLPSAQRKGKWIATKEWGGRNYSCSCCNFSFMVDTCMLEPMWNYCPNCGAEMKGESGEESL